MIINSGTILAQFRSNRTVLRPEKNRAKLPTSIRRNATVSLFQVTGLDMGSIELSIRQLNKIAFIDAEALFLWPILILIQKIFCLCCMEEEVPIGRPVSLLCF